MCFCFYHSRRYRLLDEYPAEPYTDVYWIKYVDINSARVAKRKVDNRSFFGNNLHVCYAPEYESVQDTRDKLSQRKTTVLRKTRTRNTVDQREACDSKRRHVTSAQGTSTLPQTHELPSVPICDIPGLPLLPALPLPPHSRHVGQPYSSMKPVEATDIGTSSKRVPVSVCEGRGSKPSGLTTGVFEGRGSKPSGLTAGVCEGRGSKPSGLTTGVCEGRGSKPSGLTAGVCEGRGSKPSGLTTGVCEGRGSKPSGLTTGDHISLYMESKGTLGTTMMANPEGQKQLPSSSTTTKESKVRNFPTRIILWPPPTLSHITSTILPILPHITSTILPTLPHITSTILPYPPSHHLHHSTLPHITSTILPYPPSLPHNTPPPFYLHSLTSSPPFYPTLPHITFTILPTLLPHITSTILPYPPSYLRHQIRQPQSLRRKEGVFNKSIEGTAHYNHSFEGL